MLHLGDITKISGRTAPVVDCIIGGSPCQDLSVAGKRAGLDGERSGLFMDQIRIAKEMREEDAKRGKTGVDIRPRYMVWENVPGAFSSHQGEDFRAVLEEIAKIACENATIPRPANGKWQSAGCILGDGWSIAWRVHDAQFWGVAQRRRRISLVADFGGGSAPEILFVRNSVSRDTDSRGAQRQGTQTPAQAGIGADYPVSACFLPNNGSKARGIGYQEELAPTISAKMPTPAVLAPQIPFCKEHRAKDAEDATTWKEATVANTLNAFDTGEARASELIVGQAPIFALDRAYFNQGANAQYNFEIREDGINSTLVAKGPGAVAHAIGNGQADQLDIHDVPGALNCMHDQQIVMIALDKEDTERLFGTDCPFYVEADKHGWQRLFMLKDGKLIPTRYVVRRLTPLECERLQGFPDGWTDIGDWVDTKGKKHKAADAPRYKALGNSIALPFWKWLLKRISACYERDATMASLFSGIGGFDLLWTQLNGMGSVLWESEIEEFPSAVCRRRFGDESTGEKGDFYEAILGRNKT